MRAFTLANLMELLELNASAFCRLSSLVGQMIILLNRGTTPDPEAVGATLGELQRDAQTLNLQGVNRQLERLYEHGFGGGATQISLHSMIMELYNRMTDELEDRLFLSIPVENVELYRQPAPLFGEDVERFFPRAAEDIAESGKCIALNRPTAAVFHLMRIMEIAVQEFGANLGVQLANEQNWQVILDQINAAIRKLPAKDERTVNYAGAASHLYNVKIAWRNEVMHPKQTYTDEEARAVFDSVRVFMRDLAGFL